MTRVQIDAECNVMIDPNQKEDLEDHRAVRVLSWIREKKHLGKDKEPRDYVETYYRSIDFEEEVLRVESNVIRYKLKLLNL